MCLPTQKHARGHWGWHSTTCCKAWIFSHPTRFIFLLVYSALLINKPIAKLGTSINSKKL